MSRANVEALVREALRKAVEDGALPAALPDEIEVAPPKDSRWGDFGTNVALLLGNRLSQPPREVAKVIVDRLPQAQELVESVSIDGPGFINFRLTNRWLYDVGAEVIRQGDRYGCSDIGRSQKVQLEFISANPVGPIHIGNAWGGAIGDVLANLLDAIGYEVCREYYVNDGPANTQMQKFGASLEVPYCAEFGQNVEPDDDAYPGEYIETIAAAIARRDGDKYLNLDRPQRQRALAKAAQTDILAMHRADCDDFGIRYDAWFHEAALYEDGAVDEVLRELRERGHAYELDGALWLKTRDFGDDKDRCLVRSDGAPTYLASDMAYMRNKFQRGFQHCIYVWGPHHDGYQARMKAGAAALGYDPEAIEIIIHQNVRLVEGGQVKTMSKRKGTMIPLRKLLDEVGADVARFFYLMRSADSHLDFDLELAKTQSRENPAYYVQYAHARICSIFTTAKERGVPIPNFDTVAWTLLKHADELALLRKISEFPEEVKQAALSRQPHRMTRYAQEVATAFHQFYTNCTVLGDMPDLTASRLALARASQIVLRNVLRLLGISAPERM